MGIPYLEHFHECCEQANNLIFASGNRIGMHIANDDYDASFEVIKYCPWCGKELIVPLSHVQNYK